MNDLGTKNLQKLLLSLWCILVGWKSVEMTGQNACNCLSGFVWVEIVLRRNRDRLEISWNCREKLVCYLKWIGSELILNRN